MLDQLAHRLEAANADQVLATMAEDATLRVAVHDSPSTACRSLPRSSARFWRELCTTSRSPRRSTGPTAVLMFTARVAAYRGTADGLLVVRTGAGGLISDLTVFPRPLPALQALADEMGRRLGGPRPDGGA